MTPSFALTFAMSQVSKMAQLDFSKIVPRTLFLADFCLVFETGSMMILILLATSTK